MSHGCHYKKTKNKMMRWKHRKKRVRRLRRKRRKMRARAR